MRHNKLFSFTLAFLLLLCLAHCVREVHLDSDQVPSLPVVNCFFNPDSTWTVYVSQTRPLEENAPSGITNAVVAVYADQQLEEVLSLKAPGHYSGLKKPVAGRRYTLKVQIPGFPEVSSTDYIPQPLRLTAAKERLKESSEPSCDGSCTNMTIQFHNTPGVEDFYEVEVYRYKKFGTNTWLLEYILGYTDSGGAGVGSSTDPVLLAEGDTEYTPTTLFFSDKVFDKDTVATVNFDLSGFASSGGLGAVVRLRSVSKNYYLFRKSWTRHHSRQWINNNGNGIPDFFFTPPLALTTNITGGLGVFAGFSSDTIVVTE